MSTGKSDTSNLHDSCFIQPQASLSYQPHVVHLEPCSRHDYPSENEMKQMQKGTNDSDGHGRISCPDPVNAVTVCDNMVVHNDHLTCPHEKYTENAQDPSRKDDGPQQTGKENSQHNQQQVQTTHLSPSHQQQQVVHQAAATTTNPDTRTHVVGELYDTERSYVESLQILTEKYMKPLKSIDTSKSLIDSSLVDEIFYTIPEILEHHENFLSALQDRLSSDWDSSQVIGNVFIETFTNQKIFDTYTAFINNWKNARHAIKVAIQAKPAFERFLEAMSREHRNKLTLDALLIMPVQRIPRYELLIKELIKHTYEDHPDHALLIEAQKQIHELALKIDRAEKEMIHQEQLKDLEAMIEGHVELQHPQRDFLRYDLVTISASTLTVAKKERVLFLFCDLLIMTSIKKKVSRRSNLQAAFANSYNDLSLLEGNKFKLLLRISLDQIDIKNETHQAQYAHQNQQHLDLIAHQKKYVEERRREIEADTYILRQMETLSSRFIQLDVAKLDSVLEELSLQLRDKLTILETQVRDIGPQQQDLQQQQLSTRQPGPQSDLYVIHQSASSSPVHSGRQNVSSLSQAATSADFSCLQNPNASPLQTQLPPNIVQLAALSLQQPDSNPSLEFIISNLSQTKETPSVMPNHGSTSTTSDSIPSELVNHQGSSATTTTSDSQAGSSHQVIQYETLVVTFASVDRRQAFLQAFLEAKQQRLQQQQQRQHQFHQRMFSSSMTLKLSQPNSPVKRDSRRSKLQHQDEVAENITNLSNHRRQAEQTTRITSAPYGASTVGSGTIVHQMSAPHSLGQVASSVSAADISSGRVVPCISCSPSVGSGAEKRPNHHHHHQLIHQPASHPGLLSTFCCDDQHDNPNAASNSLQPANLCNLQETSCDSLDLPRSGECVIREEGHPNKTGLDSSDNSILNLACESSGFNLVDDPKQLHDRPFRFTPKFTLSIPTNFLDTQHPALQFTTSIARREPNKICSLSSSGLNSNTQTIRDSSGLVWICMSNGYVSHVALVSFKRQKIHSAQDEAGHLDQQFYTITPVAHSAGDICKAHINCAAQVKWSRNANKRSLAMSVIDNQLVQKEPSVEIETSSSKLGTESCHDQARPPVELTIKSASPPVDIKTRACSELSDDAEFGPKTPGRLSESAPSPSDHVKYRQHSNDPTFASTNRLDVGATVTGLNRSGSSNQANPHLPRHMSFTCLPNSHSSHASRTGIQISRSNICRRPNHVSCEHLRGRMRTCSQGPAVHHSIHQRIQSAHHPAPNEHPRNMYNHHHHHHHHGHSHHHHHHQHSHHHGHYHTYNQLQPHHHHHHSHHHHNNNHHYHQPVNLYNARHHTVPLADFRRSLERQHRISGERAEQTRARHHLAPPANTPNRPQLGSLDRTDSSGASGCSSLREKKARSTTPPARFHGHKSLRSARLLRHQASLKTSSILAKLVSGASRGSSYLRKSPNTNQDKQTSDLDDNDTDTDSGHIARLKSNSNNNHTNNNNGVEGDSPRDVPSGLTVPSFTRNSVANQSNPGGNAPVVSPLSSVSSLNSTNSSITVNSACASSLNRSSCSILNQQWASSTCCASNGGQISHLGTSLQQQYPGDQNKSCDQSREGCEGHRSRSATVPCRALCHLSPPLAPDDREESSGLFAKCSRADLQASGEQNSQDHLNSQADGAYKVSEIMPDSNGQDELDRCDRHHEVDERQDVEMFSLWLGCDDGSLIMIDCLGGNEQAVGCSANECNSCDLSHHQNAICRNIHAEIKLNAPISDIKVHQDRMVFVAMANGQLAVFSRRQANLKGDSQAHGRCLSDDDHGWSIEEPQIITLATNDLNSTSKLCLVDDKHLWYSYGRSIFVIAIDTLKLETTIMTPTNDKSIQFSIQSITIENMELVANLNGVWISFRSSPLIQFYDTKNLNLLLDISLLHPINKILSYGNEIIRQHKTACLRATALLNVYNETEDTNYLFVGTSAGIIIYLGINANQLKDLNADASKKSIWNPQVVSLRHGHSGQVRLLQLVEFDGGGIENLDVADSEPQVDGNLESARQQGKRPRLCLVSGGPGVDLYGPNNEQHIAQHLNNEEDCTNHLLLWQI